MRCSGHVPPVGGLLHELDHVAGEREVWAEAEAAASQPHPGLAVEDRGSDFRLKENK